MTEKITRIDRTALGLIKQRIIDTAGPAAAELGLAISFEGGTFGDKSATLKLEVAIVAADGTVETKAKQDFEKYCALVGLKPEDFGRVFTHRGRRFKICGLKPGAGKFPLLATDQASGKVFKFPAITGRLLAAA